MATFLSYIRKKVVKGDNGLRQPSYECLTKTETLMSQYLSLTTFIRMPDEGHKTKKCSEIMLWSFKLGKLQLIETSVFQPCELCQAFKQSCRNWIYRCQLGRKKNQNIKAMLQT